VAKAFVWSAGGVVETELLSSEGPAVLGFGADGKLWILDALSDPYVSGPGSSLHVLYEER
jgi:hypothetical protein